MRAPKFEAVKRARYRLHGRSNGGQFQNQKPDERGAARRVYRDRRVKFYDNKFIAAKI